MADSGSGHLLSLKVMRVSRPSIASAWQPFYSSSPSFSSHSTASILSLQGETPLAGHPKTLRDLTHVTELLTLPSSFGSIQLGETFSSCLCVNNEAHVRIEDVTLKVEMQTVTSKVTLAELGGALGVGETLENIVTHEIKELGQHVLACTVSYRLPAGSRTVPGSSSEGVDPSLQSFRKFYKFAVTNPLSVKTKVHSPRSPSALMSAVEREKVFLEVHIQNMTPEPMWFERMRFESADGWDAIDTNPMHDAEGPFSGSQALMQPQDMRQYIYILTRKVPTVIYTPPTPGSIIPLGRLDISWRSSFGEPGRLLTSMLSRKIPLLPAPIPASALPPHLKRGGTSSSSGHQLPQSPRSESPTGVRPGSPFRNRPPSSLMTRTQTPPPIVPIAPSVSTVPSDVEVGLVVREIARENIQLDSPFEIEFTLTVSASLSLGRRRRLGLVVQHLQTPHTIVPAVSNPAPAIPEPYSPRTVISGFSTPSPMSTTFNYALAHQKLSEIVPKDEAGLELPPPFFEGPDELRSSSSGIVPCGPSAVFLPPIELIRPSNAEEGEQDILVQATQDFQFGFVPVSPGFNTVGGLRVILIEDKFLDEPEGYEDKHAKTLKEWDIVAEVWV